MAKVRNNNKHWAKTNLPLAKEEITFPVDSYLGPLVSFWTSDRRTNSFLF